MILRSDSACSIYQKVDYCHPLPSELSYPIRRISIVSMSDETLFLVTDDS